MNKTTVVLNSYTSTAAVVQVGKLIITSCPEILFKSIENGGCQIITSLAEIQAIVNVTPTATNSANHEFTITQFNTYTQKYEVTRIFYVADGGTSATEVVTGWKAMINRLNTTTALDVVATGTAVLILTAAAGNPLFTVAAVENITTVEAQQQGWVAKGQGADLIAAGIDDAVTGHTYTKVVIPYYTRVNDVITIKQDQAQVLELYLDEADGDYSTVKTALTNILDATSSNQADILDVIS